MAPPKLETMSTAVLDGGIGLVKFNRSKNANALGTQTMDDLLKGLTWALDHHQVKVVILSGEGRFFCAGMDLVDVPADGPVLSDEGIELLRQTHRLSINAQKVLIAAVNGPAVGYGTSSIALFDLVYSVPDAVFLLIKDEEALLYRRSACLSETCVLSLSQQFFTPFVKWGLGAEACSSVTFTRIMGRQNAALLILAGERMTAQELGSAGLTSKILPKETFMDEVLAVARRVAAQPPGAVTFNKGLMMEPIRAELLAANERECQGLRERGRTAEPREAIAAFKTEQEEKKKAKL